MRNRVKYYQLKYQLYACLTVGHTVRNITMTLQFPMCRCSIHFKIAVLPNFGIYLIKKIISIKVLKDAFVVKDDSEGAEYDDLEEAKHQQDGQPIWNRVEDQQQGSREL